MSTFCLEVGQVMGMKLLSNWVENILEPFVNLKKTTRQTFNYIKVCYGLYIQIIYVAALAYFELLSQLVVKLC